MEFEMLSDLEEEIARKLVDSAVAVHRTLGPGLLESVYEACLSHELKKRGIDSERQVAVPLVYDGIRFEEAFRVDMLVGENVICEIKAVDDVPATALPQLLTYLRLTGKRLGFLINFNSRLIKRGIKRVIL